MSDTTLEGGAKSLPSTRAGKRKIKVYRDAEGQYVLDTKGRKLRIRSKRPLTERELVKFLVKHLRPRRRTKGPGKTKKKALFSDEVAVGRPTGLGTGPVPPSAPDITVNLLSESEKPAALMSKKDLERYAKLTDAQKFEMLTHLPVVGEDLKRMQKTVMQLATANQQANSELRRNQLVKDLASLEAEKQLVLDNIRTETAQAIKQTYSLYALRQAWNSSTKIKHKGSGFAPASLMKERLIETKEIADEKEIERRIVEAHQAELDAVNAKIEALRKELLSVSALVELEKKEEKEQKEEEKAQEGGSSRAPPPKEGQTEDELAQMMKGHPEFLGAIAADEIPLLLKKIKPRSRGCFIINNDPRGQPGEHWRAVFFDARPDTPSPSMEFFDSYADPPSKTLLKGLQRIQTKLKPETLLKYKENKIVAQNNVSSNCGFFCVKFLQDRLSGKKFAECSGFDDSAKQEKDIEAFKARFPHFGHFPQRGKGFTDFVKKVASGVKTAVSGVKKAAEKVKDVVVDAKDRVQQFFEGAREFGSPHVRNFLQRRGDIKIVEMKVCRKPVQGMITKIANWVSGGKLAENLRAQNYETIFHLFIWARLADGQILRIEKNHIVEITQTFPTRAPSVVVNLAGHDVSTLSLFTRAEAAVGSKQLWLYDVRDNNCQKFVKDMLHSSGLWNAQLQTFAMQDVPAILRGIEGIGKGAKSITDLAGRLDVLLSGKGKGRREFREEDILRFSVFPNSRVWEGEG